MTKNEMEYFKLTELNSEESREVNGGVFGLDDLLIGIAVGAAIQIMSDWDNFKRGLTGSPEVK